MISLCHQTIHHNNLITLQHPNNYSLLPYCSSKERGIAKDIENVFAGRHQYGFALANTNAVDVGLAPQTHYLLNSNEQLLSINTDDWTGRCINKDDWTWGYGPLSNSHEMFLTTYWGSERLPLLVRRHFTPQANVLRNQPDCVE